MLDPYRRQTYALQTLELGSLDDLTALAALFFADVDHDEQRELLALKECRMREVRFTDKDGQGHSGRSSHYTTDVFHLSGTNRAGRPQYRPDTMTRPYLDELSTATVRQAFAKRQPPRRNIRP